MNVALQQLCSGAKATQLVLVLIDVGHRVEVVVDQPVQ